MGRDYFGKWQEHQAFFFSHSNHKLTRHSYKVVTKSLGGGVVASKGWQGLVFIG